MKFAQVLRDDVNCMWSKSIGFLGLFHSQGWLLFGQSFIRSSVVWAVFCFLSKILRVYSKQGVVRFALSG